MDPEDEKMLAAYAGSAAKPGDADRIERFLAAGLTNTPVNIEWHRFYQAMRRDNGRDAKLAEWYDTRLKAEPDNSALLYLRGRLCGDHAEGTRYYERSRQADPRNGFPWYALAYDRLSDGDWAGARPLLVEAVKLRPKDASMASFLVAVRTALGEFPSLEAELKLAFERGPADYLIARELVNVLATEGKPDEATRVIARFESALGGNGAAAAGDLTMAMRREALYMEGRFKELEKMASTRRDPAARNDLFEALVEQGRLGEAARIHPLDEAGNNDPYHFLAMSVAWRLQGDAPAARPWLDRAVALFEAGDADWRRAAALLTRTGAPSDAEVKEIVQPPVAKAILLAALAQLRPDRRAELAAAARRVNQTRNYPYHLVAKAVAEKPNE